MARETKRMALYEAIRKGQTKRAGGGKVVGLRSSQARRSRWSGRRKTRNLPQRVDAPGSGEPESRWSDGFFSQKVEFSLSYLTAGLLCAAFFVAFAGAVRLGQIFPDTTLPFLSSESAEAVDPDPKDDLRKKLFGEGEETTKTDNEVTARETDIDSEVVEVPVKPVEPEVVPVAPQGNNVIVIQAYFQSRDLIPVQEHFAKYGVETEIRERRNYYFLVTKERYNSFSLDRGSLDSTRDGDAALMKIKEVGAKYKAPQGYESFKANMFQDAYGEKVE